MSKIQQIIEAHLPKEIIAPLADSEYAHNNCLAEIKKALPDIEKEIVNEILNVEPNCTDEHEYQDKILTSLTK